MATVGFSQQFNSPIEITSEAMRLGAQMRSISPWMHRRCPQCDRQLLQVPRPDLVKIMIWWAGSLDTLFRAACMLSISALRNLISPLTLFWSLYSSLKIVPSLGSRLPTAAGQSSMHALFSWLVARLVMLYNDNAVGLRYELSRRPKGWDCTNLSIILIHVKNSHRIVFIERI